MERNDKLCSLVIHQNKKRREQQLAGGEQPDELQDVLEDGGQYNNTIMMKILGPVVRFVDRPWKVSLDSTPLTIPHVHFLTRCLLKMYPVGVLFGFGKEHFDA
jgi:high-affinity nickel-transport protein